MRTCLIDTGPFVAYLNRRDPAHERVVASLDSFNGLLASTSAVVAEAMYFVSDLGNGPISFAKFLAGSGVQLHESVQPEQIIAAAELMSRYSDTPMDFA